MSHQTLLHIAAYVVLISVVFIALVDGLAESDIDWAVRIKWSLAWYAARYIAISAAVFLALDTLF